MAAVRAAALPSPAGAEDGPAEGEDQDHQDNGQKDQLEPSFTEQPMELVQRRQPLGPL